MHHAFKATILAAPKGALKDLATASLSQAAAKAACFLCLRFLARLGILIRIKRIEILLER